MDPMLRETFFFTGGTLLKALGIVPRESNDLDFFTFHTVEGLVFTQRLREMHDLLHRLFGAEQVRTTDRGFLLAGSNMVIDVVMDATPPIAPFISIGNVRAASMSDLGAHKASALCSRDEVKDYIDLAFLTKHQNWRLHDLETLAEQKFGLRTVSEEKLLTELLNKRQAFSLSSGDFLHDGERNVSLVQQQIDHLIQSTTL